MEPDRAGRPSWSPPSATRPATRSGAASGIAARLGGDAGQALTAAANRAFVHAMDVTVLVGTGVALAGALVAVLCLPARARQPAVSRSGP